jgi:eukaryotic-like serine/threonine-protein kinase
MAEPKRADNSSQGNARRPVPPVANDDSAADINAGGDGAAPASRDLTGRTLGDFCLLRKLGKGGMAEVYLAEQISLHRQVAIKIMRSDFVTDPQYVKRFRHEASAAGGLNHPNIVQVHMVGEQDGIHFISQEYVQGRNLKEFITRKGPLDVPIALHVLKQVAAALQVASEKGIVHRDIKPENILVTKKGEAKVADFGLAQLTLGGERVQMTQVGVAMGTPLYMSPEQVNGKTLDVRSDIYSLGVMAWHMLVGHPPFQGDTAMAVAVKHLNEEPPSLREARPDVPPAVCALVHKMMSKKKEDRPADAQTVLGEFKQLLRQATGKEAAPVESAFRPTRSSSLQIRGQILDRPMRRQLGWLIGACILMAASSAGIGWAMRTADPLKLPVTSPPKVEKFPSIEGQFYHAQGNPNEEAAWIAVKTFEDPADAAHREISDRIKDRAEINLAMIYLKTRRKEQAERIFNEFASSPDPWRKVHGIAGQAILADLGGDKGTLRKQAAQAEEQAQQNNNIKRLEPVVEHALREALKRNENRP